MFLCVNIFGIVTVSPVPLAVRLRYILPCGVCFSMSIYLGNYCYLFLSVSVVQICKAFAPVVMMLSMVVCGMEKLDMAITLAMGLITLGTILTVTGGTIVVQWLGLASLGLSMVADTTKLILTQIMMKDQGLRLDVYESMYYLSPVSAVFVVVLIYFIELDQILESLPAIQDNYLPILASGILGIIVNVAGLLIIAGATNSDLYQTIYTTHLRLLCFPCPHYFA
jgi:hypothetical protein